MSSLHATTYDWPASVTLSDTANDPQGPFAGLLCTQAGVVTVFPMGGPFAASGLTLTVVAGQTLAFPISRVGATNTQVAANSLLGLVGASIARQGGFAA